ncbi:MAG: hypothetical protein COV66_09570 [Nitrospinae bacterium CG11_big_fil_rev_8_21_14_0_20_45_15]|jgi:hypothetical protein|nr:MAG: hypothetical protein COV66_09570 [Nitrospinae bacterium CG11_big_fil_rev_8_21_14_0_20_45_15]
MLAIFPKAFSVGFSSRSAVYSSSSSDIEGKMDGQNVPWFVKGESQAITMIPDGSKLDDKKPS